MKVIISSAIVHMRQAVARSMFRYCLFLNPICNAILLGMMYSDKSSHEFTLYAILGTSLSSFWTIICFSSASDISREKYLGTLPVLFTSPSGFKKIILGKLLGNSLWGLFAFLLNIYLNKVDYELEIEFDKDNQSALKILEYLGIKTQDSTLGKNKRFVQELKRHQ